MNKRAVAIISLFLLSVLTPAISSAGGAALTKLADNVYAYMGEAGGANSGFVIIDKGVVVIDSQGPQDRALDLKARIRAATKLSVKYVINTHYHGDHTFGNQFFKGTIISHERARNDLIEKDKSHQARFKKFFGPKSLDGFRLTLPEITFSHELRLHEGNKTIIITHPGPAHTRGDAYVFLPEERIVFTGDILYKRRLPWLGEGSVAGNIKAINGLLALKADIYVPGHGAVATKKDVFAYRGYLEALTREVKRLKAEGKTIKEVKAEISLPAYSGYLKYKTWLPLNAGALYRELEKAKK